MPSSRPTPPSLVISITGAAAAARSLPGGGARRRVAVLGVVVQRGAAPRRLPLVASVSAAGNGAKSRRPGQPNRQPTKREVRSRPALRFPLERRRHGHLRLRLQHREQPVIVRELPPARRLETRVARSPPRRRPRRSRDSARRSSTVRRLHRGTRERVERANTSHSFRASCLAPGATGAFGSTACSVGRRVHSVTPLAPSTPWHAARTSRTSSASPTSRFATDSAASWR